MTDRYDTSGNPEGLYQIGSNNQVLLNKLAIVDPAEMDQVELELLDQHTGSLVLRCVFEIRSIALYDQHLPNVAWEELTYDVRDKI